MNTVLGDEGTERPEYERKFVGTQLDERLRYVSTPTNQQLFTVFSMFQYYLPNGQRLRYSKDPVSGVDSYVLAAPKRALSDGGNGEDEQPITKAEFEALLAQYQDSLKIHKQRLTFPVKLSDNKKSLEIDQQYEGPLHNALIRCDVDTIYLANGKIIQRGEMETQKKDVYVSFESVLKADKNTILLPTSLSNKLLSKIEHMGMTDLFIMRFDEYQHNPQQYKEGFKEFLDACGVRRWLLTQIKQGFDYQSEISQLDEYIKNPTPKKKKALNDLWKFYKQSKALMTV